MGCRRHNFVIAVAIGTSGLSLACSKTTTSLTTPTATTADKCQVSVSSVPTSFSSSGGQGSLAIATSRDCTWSVKTDANWVSIAADSGGQGEASIPYTVSPNPVPSSRAGAITVGSQSVAISQAAVPCVFRLSRAGDGIAAAGGRLAVDVTTLNGCSWNATSGSNWIVVSSGQTGNASGTVGLAVASNDGASRVGEVTIAGQRYAVTQAAPAPAPAPNPTPAPTPAPKKVDFEGPVSGVSGGCPNVTIAVRGLTIVVDRSTDFEKSSCGDLRAGSDVEGSGVTQPNGTINATDIRVREDKDDD